MRTIQINVNHFTEVLAANVSYHIVELADQDKDIVIVDSVTSPHQRPDGTYFDLTQMDGISTEEYDRIKLVCAEVEAVHLGMGHYGTPLTATKAIAA